MATINDLINAACEIRDADQDRENTAMRVGSLLVDIIDYIGGFVSISTLQNILADYAALDSRGQVEWRQSRVISLYSMGTEYDNVDGGDWTPESLPVGSVVYEKSGSSHRLHFKKTSDTIEDYSCILNAIYINLHSLRLYTFSETEGMVELSTNGAGGGGTTVTITKGGGYVDIDIIDNTPRITLSPQSIAMSGNDKTATFKVSGVNLKGAISINGNNAYFSKSPRSISPVGGVVNDATVTVTFGGTNDDTDDLTVSSPGATAQTIHVAYTAVAGPNIVVSPATLSFKAATNQTQTKQVAVQGSLLTDDVEVTAGGAFQVSLQSGSGFANSVTIPKASALAGITVYVRYTAGSSATTGTLTLTSDGAADKTVDLAGAVNGTLSISPASASIGIVSGGSGTAQFTVTGANLTPASTASVAVSGTGMSADKQTLTVGQDGTINEVVTVTFSGSADSNGTLTVSHADVDDDATASIAGSIVTPLPANASFKVDGIHYKVNSDQVSVRVWNGSSESGAASTKYSGAITIPASVSDSGVTANLDGGGTQVGAGATYAVTQLATYAFGGCTNLTSLTLPEGLRKISSGAIRECKNSSFKTLVIPSTVNYIGSIFLWDCTYLETVEMRCYNNPNWDSNNTTWGGSNSGNCNKLTKLTSFAIPDGFINYAGSSTYGNFYNCSAMTEITFGKGLKNFNDLFGSCPNITKIYCRSTTPPTINASSGTSFYIPASVYENAQVYVPRGYVQAYLNAEDPHPVNGEKPKMWSLFNANHALIEYDPD